MLELVLVVIALLLWFVWKQLERIAIVLRLLHIEATRRYPGK